MTNEQAKALAEKIGGPKSSFTYDSTRSKPYMVILENIEPGCGSGSTAESAFLAAGVKVCTNENCGEWGIGHLELADEASTWRGKCPDCEGQGYTLVKGS